MPSRLVKKLPAAILAVVCLLVQTGQGAPATAATDAPVPDKPMKVVTTFTVIADMAANVAGEFAQVVSITKPGAEIHGYEPTPQDIVRALDADLVLWNGLNLEAWFKPFIAHLGDVASVTLSQDIEPIPITSGRHEGAPNPHAWMGLGEALVYIDTIAAAFSRHDPANAAAYRANAAAYKQRLQATIAPLRALVGDIPPHRRWIVTCEGAFSYLARDLGLRELFLWPINTDQVGTPQQMRRVIDTMRAHDIPVIFCESTLNPAPARQVARETGAAYGGVLYIDSLSGADGPVPTYLDLIGVTTRKVVQGLAGGIVE